MQLIPYSLYPTFVRSFLFMLEPEVAHDVILKSAKFISDNKYLLPLFSQQTEFRPVKAMGLEFKNPLGLAAGLDKNAEAVDFFGALGFGHIEVGTVTPKAQDGNPKPRMFRIPGAQGIINRMGFNNKGVDYLVSNLKNRKYEGILGVSVGKNESTPLESAVNDYTYCIRKVYPYADYIAVNVSCPNTPGLTKLQAKEPLYNLLKPVKAEQKNLNATSGRYVPLVVKFSPDLNDEALENLCNVCLELEIDGVICTNTTTRRDVINGMEHASEWGGLSGEPLRSISSDALRRCVKIIDKKIPVIGVGGISNAVNARERLNDGATLLQIYSSLIYRGPNVIKSIVNNI